MEQRRACECHGYIFCNTPSRSISLPTASVGIYSRQVWPAPVSCMHARQFPASRRTDTCGPKGPQCSGKVGPKRTTQPICKPAARCEIPESLPTKTRQCDSTAASDCKGRLAAKYAPGPSSPARSRPNPGSAGPSIIKRSPSVRSRCPSSRNLDGGQRFAALPAPGFKANKGLSPCQPCSRSHSAPPSRAAASSLISGRGMARGGISHGRSESMKRRATCRPSLTSGFQAATRTRG